MGQLVLAVYNVIAKYIQLVVAVFTTTTVYCLTCTMVMSIQEPGHALQVHASAEVPSPI